MAGLEHGGGIHDAGSDEFDTEGLGGQAIQYGTMYNAIITSEIFCPLVMSRRI